jgi:predicted benzoate:H+ symporter BenE
MDTSYVGRNQAESRRLAELVARLTEQDLQTSLGDGWTVKAALAHLAFWDRYSAGLLDGWSASGFQPVATSADHVNAAAVGDWLALPAEHVRREVVAAAEAIDRRIEAVPPELAAAIVAGGRSRTLDRSPHRTEHVDQIVAALGQ